MTLNDLGPDALSAAMRGGVDGWGQHGSAIEHVRYMDSAPVKSRRRCRCGCKKVARYSGKANGVALTMGCEMSIRRWVKAQSGEGYCAKIRGICQADI